MEYNNDQPIYIQIAAHIKEQIANGQLKANDKLPSVREYSVFFEVSALTIQRTMEYLAKEQLIVSRKGIGNFVACERTDTLQTELVTAQTRSYIQSIKNCGLSSSDIKKLIARTLQEESK